MQFIETFNLTALLDTFVSLLGAFLLGTLIGVERQYRQRSAGLRTNVLVAVGAAAFVDLALLIAGTDGAARVISYVVSGVGFLGAGVIMKDGGNVRGLNTAATLWASAAVGACAGADRLAEAGLVTVFILAGNTLLHPLVNAINRLPIDEGGSEANYEVRVLAETHLAPEIRERITDVLKQAKYPVADIKMEPGTDDRTEIVATLVSTTVDAQELNAAASTVRRLAGVRRVSWEVSTLDS
ncbi:MgtC/SapB family protein [Chelatococcus asaccharovorans]|uniref:MgtC/SapB family protein n=1 Tax=Chelatococcus asaccharovorans TaxID=28210 RepID=UPI00224C6C73|nr:MgtC/SapB family protein [Chelatococcus asaccharovorans]CAH1654640.1 Protein MgtC [Chelatococcus asaccharovorans]CAH1690871.1 Protein MgtC [Chelatococcus asaccharovorans]